MKLNDSTRNVIPEAPPPEGEPELAFTRWNRLKLPNIMPTALIVGIFAENV
jgi:hypothetical protein